MKLTTLSKVVLALHAAGQVDAFWRMPCQHRSGLARLDPLVNPGSISPHAHSIHGSSGFSATSSTPELLAGECTSCEVSQDKSAYWTPSLYFQNAATGEFELVDQVGGMLAYYLLFPNSGNTSLSAFPAGFAMISGDTSRRNFTAGPVPDPPKSDWTAAESTQEALAQKALGFNCLNYNAAAEGSLYRHFLPDKAYLDANCADGVRFELMFPSCWNGVDLDSANHRDHVAFPTEVMTGDCPEGFPIRLVSLFYETIWNTAAYVGVDGEFVISNGDPTGYGYHGDFIMGWEEEFLQEAVDTCTNASGQISDCALFDIQSGADCNFTVPDVLANDNVVGPMATLPGNDKIQAGPGPADEGATAPASASYTPVPTETALVPTLSHSDGTTIASTGSYAVGAVFIEGAATTASSSTSSSAPAPATTAAPTAPAVDDTDQYFSTDYQTNGREVLEILWIEETVYVPQQVVATTTSYTTSYSYNKRSEQQRKRGLSRHLHRHAEHGR